MSFSCVTKIAQTNIQKYIQLNKKNAERFSLLKLRIDNC